jgi:ABC-type nickel/cobalt efflux system permease component RcnA
MTLFDKFFFSVFKYYKDAQNKKANTIATVYISVLQSALMLLLGVFFAGFFKQMNVNTLSQDKAITLFVLACIFIFFKNWMQYAGRKRKVLNAKMLKSKSLGYNIWLIWLLPVVCLGLSLIIYQAV